MNETEFKTRTKEFALRVLKLVDAFAVNPRSECRGVACRRPVGSGNRWSRQGPKGVGKRRPYAPLRCTIRQRGARADQRCLGVARAHGATPHSAIRNPQST